MDAENPGNERWLASCGPCRAVTLAELVVVTVVLAVAAVIAVPAMGNLLRRERLEQAGAQVMADVRLARAHAISHREEAFIVFDIYTHSYSMPFIPNPDNPEAGKIVTIDPSEGGIGFVGASFDEGQILTFTPLGVPVAGGSVILGDAVEEVWLNVSSTTGRVTREFRPVPDVY